MEYRVKPIVAWPGVLTEPLMRRQASFRVTYSQTLEELDRELEDLEATNVVIQLAVSSGEIRIDGRPYANCRPVHPGVIITFNSSVGPLSYWTDEFDDWHDNVRAIGLALKALRAIDRYGVNQRGSQYAGYKQLPGGTGAPGAGPYERGPDAYQSEPDGAPGIHTINQAREFIALHAKLFSRDLIGREAIERAYKRAAFNLHPDRGGDPALFLELQRHIQTIRKIF